MVELSRIMISKKPYRGLIFTILTCVSLGVAGASATLLEDEMRLYISTHKEISRHFSNAYVNARHENRLEAWATDGRVRRALVLYKPLKKSQSTLGQMYCHSALGQKERVEIFDQILKKIEGDTAIASRLAPDYGPVIRFVKTESVALVDWRGWQVSACEVNEADLRVTYTDLPSGETIQQAIYAEGKAQFYNGNHEQAMSRFKSLKGFPEIYSNSLFYLVVILSGTHPEIAESLRHSHLRLDQVTDGSALEAYYQYLLELGDLDEQAAVSEVCRERGLKCGSAEGG